MTIVEMCVHMDCAGCELKIRKALQRLEGVDEVDVDMERQKVTVTGWVEQKKVLKAVRKTGRRAVLWPYSSVDSHNFNHYYYNQANPTPAVTGYYNHHHHHHPAIGPGASSSYNYYKHGYDNFRGYGYDQHGGGGSSIFSDENPHACSIM